MYLDRALLSFANNEEHNASICRGKIYRYKSSSFLNKKGDYVHSERMIPMKRKSCSGCVKCGWVDEFLSEDISSGKYPLIEDIKEGALYYLDTTNESRDFESGEIDDFDLVS